MSQSFTPGPAAYCPSCHKEVAPTARYCLTCGATLAGGQPAFYAPAVPPVTYAGFWKRFAAYFIDRLLVNVVVGLIGAVLPMLLGELAGSLVAIVLMLVCPWLYYALMESSDMQATLGKRLVGLRVTDLQGEPLTFGRASGRFWGRLLSNLTMSIGYLMAAFTEKKQTLHDKVSGCLVVEN